MRHVKLNMVLIYIVLNMEGNLYIPNTSQTCIDIQ